MMENLFNALCAGLLHPANRGRFLTGEGVQLMNIMLREKAESRESALKVGYLCAGRQMVDIRSIQVLDYATTGPEGKACSEKFLEVFGLRTLFPLFLRTPGKAKPNITGAPPTPGYQKYDLAENYSFFVFAQYSGLFFCKFAI